MDVCVAYGSMCHLFPAEHPPVMSTNTAKLAPKIWWSFGHQQGKLHSALGVNFSDQFAIILRPARPQQPQLLTPDGIDIQIALPVFNTANMPPEPFPVLVHPFPGPTPRSCAYEAGSPTSRNALVFIGGLGDGPHTVPYVRALASRLQSEPELGYSVFEVRLSSAFGGFGYRRLADDVADLAALVRHLRGALGRDRVVLLGHSTGCQDCMEYTDYAKHGAEPVDGFILQGPVSDREAFGPLISKEELEAGVAKAAELVGSGRGDAIMPRDKLSEMFDTPITAYRYYSLLAPG